MSVLFNPSVQQKERKYIKLESKAYKQQRFQFRSYDLAFAVREVCYKKIIAFDSNNDRHFQQHQIHDFLINILNSDLQQIHYMTRNVFRYDYNNDGVITYDELVNFCMEQHFGEIAIQRLHKKKLYNKGSQRMMNQTQFKDTVKYALSFIQFAPPDEDLKMIFEAADLDKDNYISYEDYFRLLKEYFGSKSYAAVLVHESTVLEEIKNQQGSKQKKPMDIVKKYSKYDHLGGNNANGDNVKPLSNITPNIINSIVHNGLSTLGTSTLTHSSLQNSNANNPSTITSNNDKKSKPQNSKIQLTINQKAKSEISLSTYELSIAEKISKLVCTQLKLALVYYDLNQDCFLTNEEICSFLKKAMKYSQNQITEVIKKGILSKDRKFSFQETAKIVILENINRVFRQSEIQVSNKNMKLNQFVQTCQKVCGIVKNTPITSKYENLYKSRCEKGNISWAEAENVLVHIFSVYQFKK